ncbi:MAG: NAD(P)/FAD-dependent oxidoreductase [Myxococcota bacterium]
MTREPDPAPAATSRRGFLGGLAAAATAGGIAGFACASALEKRHRAPAGPFFAQRSHCHWIESAGIEDAPLLAPLEGDQSADIAIVGAGYTGLSAALHLAERYPERRIVLLEGARVGYGASGRNCGLLLPYINGAESITHGLVEAGRLEEARKVFDLTSAGIGLIRALSEERGIDCEFEPVENLTGAITASQEAKLEAEQRVFARLGLDATWLPEAELRKRVDVEGYRGALTVPTSAMVNPAKLATGLLGLVRRAGVDVYEDSPAIEISPGPTVSIRTPRGEVRTPVLVLATNAYTHHLGFQDRRILPIHSHSIATAPLSRAQVEALSWTGRQPFFDVRAFFNLFRLTADDRVLLSGGDGFYYYGGAAIDREGHPDYTRLAGTLVELFPALADVPITHRWVGHVGTTLDFTPTIGSVGPDDNIFFAGGYSGHGVTVAVLAGRLLRDLVSGEPLDPVYDFVLNRQPPRAPGEPLAAAGFGLAKRLIRWDDAR